ncbi:hypothetical protein EUX98_g6159 [Antrodiella citrinella]|uniref:Epoxide hydrolase N-terminal domain-containing protein n=1 Tax=Antrodiella citrinella TaxID=2447956 RepID=A0A4S4MPU0_9APHY|nr:hypothetical protein EUX98_g6159 [Antrodiella citrinella]
MTEEKTFKLTVPDSELELLRKKLDLARFPDELNEAGWEYGTPLADVRRLVARWKDGFDWRAAEAKINELPQFTRDIDVDRFGTLNIHYVHAKSASKDALPLLFVHGWPGHFMEVAKILPLLTSPSGDHRGFHVVALSLPGYGFSEGPKDKGFTIPQYAEVAHKLMLALGYNKYVAQGGDLGTAVSRNLAHLYGHKHVQAWHTNMPSAVPPTFYQSPLLYLQYLLTPFSSSDVKGLQKTKKFQDDGRGYMGMQSTRPQTLGYSIADSPVGLLAWVYEKLVAWTDNYPWEDDEVLAWVSIYWFSRDGPATTFRIYYEYVHNRKISTPPWTSVPFGISYFPEEIAYTPKLWMRTVGNVVFESEHTTGGHFAAHEKPNELVEDLRTFFSKEVVVKAFK